MLLTYLRAENAVTVFLVVNNNPSESAVWDDSFFWENKRQALKDHLRPRENAADAVITHLA